MRHHFLMSIYSYIQFNILFRDRKVLINSIYSNNGYKITCYVKIVREQFFSCVTSGTSLQLKFQHIRSDAEAIFYTLRFYRPHL